MNHDESLRQHLVELLTGENAHVGFERGIAGLPVELRGVKAGAFPHTAWQLAEHLRIAQWDLLQFSVDPNHVSPEFPAGYWPESGTPPNSEAWEKSVDGFRADLKAMVALITDPTTDLFARIPHGDGQTILREALVLADHNAYHLGQLLVVRRLLGAWDEA